MTAWEDLKAAHREVLKEATWIEEDRSADADALILAVQKRAAARIRWLAENARHADTDHETTKKILELAALEAEREIVRDWP